MSLFLNGSDKQLSGNEFASLKHFIKALYFLQIHVT